MCNRICCYFFLYTWNLFHFLALDTLLLSFILFLPHSFSHFSSFFACMHVWVLCSRFSFFSVLFWHLVLTVCTIYVGMYLKSVNGTKTKLEHCGGNFFLSKDALVHPLVDIISAVLSMVVAIISSFSLPLSNYLVVNHIARTRILYRICLQMLYVRYTQSTIKRERKKSVEAEEGKPNVEWEMSEFRKSGIHNTRFHLNGKRNEM